MSEINAIPPEIHSRAEKMADQYNVTVPDLVIKALVNLKILKDAAAIYQDQVDGRVDLEMHYKVLNNDSETQQWQTDGDFKEKVRELSGQDVPSESLLGQALDLVDDLSKHEQEYARRKKVEKPEMIVEVLGIRKPAVTPDEDLKPSGVLNY